MIRSARNDYVELSYIYGGTITVLIFLSLVAIPMDTSRFGLIIPKTESAAAHIYASESFADLSIKAESSVVYDLVDKKVIASKNGEVPLPLASITKVMTAITALTHNDKNTAIAIRPESVEEGYDLGLKKDQVWTLSELLKYTLVFSSNDGAHAVADSLGGRSDFVAQMNTDSALLGLGLTFTEPAGLDVDNVLGGKGSALDVAKLFGIARKSYPEIFEATTKTRVTVTADGGRLSGIPNTNQDITSLFGAEVSKTGFTDMAGGNLGVVIDVALGHPVVIVVLGSTREERFTDMELLYQALLKSVQ
jgi:serine-type D-Ala-D-Ala carboxypeptidase (penicillin-binding protein 5/6)